MNYLGNHLLVELYNCETNVINDVLRIEELLLEAVKISGATTLNSTFHKFSPHGVSGVVVISESHFSIHTWPEYGYGAMDFYTCGSHVDPEKGLNYAVDAFGASTSHITEITRGLEEGDQIFYHSFVTWEEEFGEEEKK